MNLTNILVSLCACAAFASACTPTDDDNTNGGSNAQTAAQLLYDDVIWMATSNGGEQSQLMTQGNNKHSFDANITDGAEFCSFKMTYKESNANGALGKIGVFIYLDANESDKDRTATITVAFSDGTPNATLRLVQRAYSPSAKYDRHQWAELPQHIDNSDYIYKTYYTTLASGAATVRNYSICYDSKRRVSQWVAYPVHTCYTSPSIGRSDAWAYDDAVTEKTASGYKIVEYRVTQPAIPQDLQQYIIGGAYGTGHNRGHMLPSASRYSTWETNAQTFYATNMMPQHGGFNSGAWASLESIVRKNGGTASRDTLYVVTGTYFEDGYTLKDRKQSTVAVPSHAYKVLLKAKNRIPEGKTIADLEAGELQAIGFWFPNPKIGEKATVTVQQAVCTVAEIEEKTGFDYFRMLRPDVAAAVKQQCNPGSWSGL